MTCLPLLLSYRKALEPRRSAYGSHVTSFGIERVKLSAQGNKHWVMKAVIVALGQTKVNASEFGVGFKGHGYHKGKGESPQVPINMGERKTTEIYSADMVINFNARLFSLGRAMEF
jgi:hypothetical protein